MKKLLALLLAAFVSVALTACGDTPAETTVTTEPVETTPAEDALGIPLTADFGNAEFRILSAGNTAHEEFTFDEESSLPLENARYRHKAKVEEAYKINITQDVEVAYSSGGGPGFLAISKQVTSGDCDYDLALIAGYDVSVLAYNGYLYNLGAVPGIDLSKSWWDRNAVESLSIRDVTFFTTGEITTSDNDYAFVTIFNKKLVDDYQLEDPYELVHNNEWTIEKMASMAKMIGEDLNQDGVMNLEDRVGLMVWDDSIVGIVNAAGQRCCTINESGAIELTIYNETTLAALEDYYSIAYDDAHALRYQRIVKSQAEERGFWKGDHALFWLTWMGHVPALREMESDFGILPMPKLSPEQENYHSTIAPYHSQYICVPLIQNDVERTGIVTEALAYYGKQIVTPAYYDISLTGQSLRDEESEEMLDIVFDSLMYDIGYCYQVGPYNKQLILMLREGDTNFTSRYDRYKPAAEVMLKIINEYYAEAVAEWE